MSGVSHTPVSTDDGDACTTDACDPASGVTHTAVTVDDGNACTTDSCHPASGVSHTEVDPEDGIACTVDSCDGTSGDISHVYDDSLCDDGIACTEEHCGAEGCVAGGANNTRCPEYEACSTTEGCVPQLTYCVQVFPATMGTTGDEASPLFYGRLYEVGVTDPAGASPQIRAEAGFGPSGTDPRTHSSWTYVAATWSAQVGFEDEYAVSFPAPAPGQYAYVYRFSDDDGASWTYCDRDGSGTAGGAFSPDSLGTWIVAEP